MVNTSSILMNLSSRWDLFHIIDILAILQFPLLLTTVVKITFVSFSDLFVYFLVYVNVHSTLDVFLWNEKWLLVLDD